jgi:4-methylaminobutanoate oxidase (formaldehyde-forming)
MSVFDAIVAEGAAFGMKLAGYHALNSLRLECGYRHWGHDISDETSPYEGGLGFAVALDKPGGFIGREALLRQRGKPLQRRVVGVLLDEPGPLLYHDEPIWRDDRVVGAVTSGMFGHSLGRAIGLAQVREAGGVDAAFLGSGRWAVEIAGERVPAQLQLRPFYDPKRERVKL